MNPETIKKAVETLPDISCKCGSKMFTPIGVARDLSALQSPSGQRTLVYMQLGYLCIGCGSIITMQVTPEGNFLWIPNVESIVFTGSQK